MGKESKIEWTNSSWSPWQGCPKVSAGCKNCYMYRHMRRWGKDPGIVFKSKGSFLAPLSWKKPRMVFVCSISDFFVKEADDWRDEAWSVIKRTPHHTYQILTKRPERIQDCLPDDWGDGYANVWLGISAENQEMFNERIVIFNEIKASIKFVSFEPLLEPIYIYHSDIVAITGDSILGPKGAETKTRKFIDWAIIGGESGNLRGKEKARDCKTGWVHRLIVDCSCAGADVFVKQTGTILAKRLGLSDRHGKIISEWPLEIQYRETPNR